MNYKLKEVGELPTKNVKVPEFNFPSKKGNKVKLK